MSLTGYFYGYIWHGPVLVFIMIILLCLFFRFDSFIYDSIYSKYDDASGVPSDETARFLGNSKCVRYGCPKQLKTVVNRGQPWSTVVVNRGQPWSYPRWNLEISKCQSSIQIEIVFYSISAIRFEKTIRTTWKNVKIPLRILKGASAV